MKSKDRGLLVVNYFDLASNEIKMGTVCTGNFDYYMADLFCKKLGYKYGKWRRTKDGVEFFDQQ